MTNQQNINFSKNILHKRNMVVLYAFYNTTLFQNEMDILIRGVLYEEFGVEGHLLKYELYKYLEDSKKNIKNENGYLNIIKAINSNQLKQKRKNINKIIEDYRKEVY